MGARKPPSVYRRAIEMASSAFPEAKLRKFAANESSMSLILTCKATMAPAPSPWLAACADVGLKLRAVRAENNRTPCLPESIHHEHRPGRYLF